MRTWLEAAAALVWSQRALKKGVMWMSRKECVCGAGGLGRVMGRELSEGRQGRAGDV